MGIKGVLIIWTLLLASFIAGGQVNENLLEEGYKNYHRLWPQTNLHLVFNQSKYAPSDTIWLKAYFLKDDLSAVEGNQLIQIKLIGTSEEGVLTSMFETQNGIGHHHFLLPDSLLPGNYYLIAYNDWMKNFDPIPYFKYLLKVVGQKAISGSNEETLQVKAEGGHLLAGIANIVGIYTGRANERIVLTNEVGEELQSITTNASGLAQMVVSPEKNSSAKYTFSSGNSSVDIIAQPTGFGLQLFESKNQNLEKSILITSVGQYTMQSKLFLIATTKGQVFHAFSITLKDAENKTLLLPTTNLPTGVVELSLLDATGHLVAFREFYHRSNDQIKVKTSGLKQIYSTRDKVDFEIALFDGSGNPVQGEFSYKVVNGELFALPKENDFEDNIQIFLGRKEKLESDKAAKSWSNDLDGYLIATAIAIPWYKVMAREFALFDALMAKTPQHMKSLMYREILSPRYNLKGSIQKSGKVFFADTNSPLPNGSKLTFYLQQSKMRYQVVVGDNGYFNLEILPVQGTDELMYIGEVDDKVVTNLSVIWLQDELDWPIAQSADAIDSLDNYGTYATKRNVINNSYATFESDFYNKRAQIAKVTKTFEEEVNGLDAVYDVDGFTIFPTMNEFIKEIVKSVSVIRKSGRDAVRMKIYPWVSHDDPIYIIDGIATTNTSYFLSLRPNELETLGLVNDHRKLIRFGALGKNGIIVVRSKSGNMREPTKDQSLVVRGLSEKREFHHLDFTHSNSNPRPHFRSTVEWMPSITTNVEGNAGISFFASDDTGEMYIIIEGMTTTGHPFSCIKMIDVVYR